MIYVHVVAAVVQLISLFIRFSTHEFDPPTPQAKNMTIFFFGQTSYADCKKAHGKIFNPNDIHEARTNTFDYQFVKQGYEQRIQFLEKMMEDTFNHMSTMKEHVDHLMMEKKKQEEDDESKTNAALVQRWFKLKRELKEIENDLKFKHT